MLTSASGKITIPKTIATTSTDSGNFVVAEDVYWTWRGRALRAERGVVSDMASVPWPVRWYIGRTGRHQNAALIHDICYANNERPIIFDATTGDHVKFTRAEADEMFLEAMHALDVVWYHKYAAYLAVVCWGWIVW